MTDGDLRKAQEMLGHTTISTTLRYAHLAPSALQKAVAALDELGAKTLNPQDLASSRSGLGTSWAPTQERVPNDPGKES